MLLLSMKAGLRAAEIAQLTWPMVLRPDGHVSNHIALDDRIAKKRSGRTTADQLKFSWPAPLAVLSIKSKPDIASDDSISRDSRAVEPSLPPW